VVSGVVEAVCSGTGIWGKRWEYVTEVVDDTQEEPSVDINSGRVLRNRAI
jgi:hypothetical protein